MLNGYLFEGRQTVVVPSYVKIYDFTTYKINYQNVL